MSAVPQRGKRQPRPRRAVQKHSAQEGQCPRVAKGCSAEHGPRGVVQSKVPHRASAKLSAIEGQYKAQCTRVQVRRAVKAKKWQCRRTVPQKGSAEAQCPRVPKRGSDEHSP